MAFCLHGLVYRRLTVSSWIILYLHSRSDISSLKLWRQYQPQKPTTAFDSSFHNDKTIKRPVKNTQTKQQNQNRPAMR